MVMAQAHPLCCEAVFSQLLPPIVCAVSEGLLGLDTWAACCRRDFLGELYRPEKGKGCSFFSKS